MKEYPKLLIADKNGNIQYMPDLQATGMKAGVFFTLQPRDLMPVHPDSELFILPERKPVGFDPVKNDFVTLENNIFRKKSEPCFAVSVFMAPGHTSAYNAAFTERSTSKILPLFSYSAVAYYKNTFYTAGIRIDREKRQDLGSMDIDKVRKNAKIFRNMYPGNRLIGHLENCALCYGCPAAKNFFLKRYEGPLPTSPRCNAACMGCISYQENKKCPVTQPRIRFMPRPEEIAEIAIFHIKNVADPVVSFGQGCEGEPLMVSDTLIEAVRLIRNATKKGIINLNTNASKPQRIKELFITGLDSIRVSMNSVRKKFYELYYRPSGYRFEDVLRSIDLAKKNKGFVSVNYLVMPGFTDNKREVEALLKFLSKYKIDMIQWRNLNYDPLRYFKELMVSSVPEDMIGVDTLINIVKKEFPGIMHGYFNPSKGRMRRARAKQMNSGM